MTPTRTVKVNAVIDQVSDEAVPILDESMIKDHYVAYETVFKRMPPEGKECTTEQLSGLYSRITRGAVPYVDFSLWCPYGQRFQKKLRLKGLNLHASGEFKLVEISGPPTYQDWVACYELLITGLIGFNVVDLGHLLGYQTKVREYFEKYGSSMWILIYQAENRMRLEQMERLHRTLHLERTKAEEFGVPSFVDFDIKRPWNAVWRRAIEDDKFWKKELEDPALMILTKARPIDHAL